jgi:hypothetical protein
VKLVICHLQVLVPTLRVGTQGCDAPRPVGSRDAERPVRAFPRRAWERGAWLLALLAVASTAQADNIDLATVPSRDTVQLTIYNSEDLTLVRETRKVTFKRGANPLQFSWANTLIDSSSVQLKFLTQADKLDVLDTTFPHARPQMLYWNVQSEFDGEAVIQITYFTSGITWSADYIALADAGEQTVRLDGFVGIQNRSGEVY